ncbi:MAG: Type II secretion system protein D [Chlamydiae bacterium]|nr:Type II secretion system protein D [Chlamydiota bacterium]
MRLGLLSHNFAHLKSIALAFVGTWLLAVNSMAFADTEDFDDEDFIGASEEIADSSDVIGWSLFSSGSGEDRYTINFNNVSIIEYIRFVSKITGNNFVYEEADLPFTVSIVSEEPITVTNIMSALIQTLRIHNLKLLENEGNLIITKNLDVNQIPTIISPEGSSKHAENAPIVTRIFRIKNANLNSVASIIRPMTSKTAIVDVSNETRQLIVTDITTNVEQISTLLQSLDSPHSPLEIDIYHAHHMPVKTLTELAGSIVKPFAEDNSLIYVAQEESNTIFIVSTPYLIERSMEIFEDLDVRPKGLTAGQLTKDAIYLYKIKHKTSQELIQSLKNIAKELERSGAHSIKLIDALEHAKWVKDSNSILFITDPETQTKLEDILQTLDSFSDTRNFYIYKVEQAGVEQVESSLEKLARSLEKGGSDRDLVHAIESMRYIKETNSFIFTGTDESLKKLGELLPTFDVAVSQYSPSSHYWLYTPEYLSGKELETALGDLLDSMESAGLADEQLLNSIESMKWVPATNTLLFTGDPASLDQIKSILKLIDVPSGAPTKIFLYQPRYVSNEQIEEALDELADRLEPKNLSDRNLAGAIDTMTWIGNSQSFLFKADPGTIEKIQGFLKDIDNPKEGEAIAQAYVLYNLKHARGDDVIDHLEMIAKNLPEKDPSQKAIIDVIDDLSFLKETNALLLTGSQKAVEDVKELISQFDVPKATPAAFEKTSFFIYRPLYVNAEELKVALEQTANDLQKSGLLDPTLLSSIATMRYVGATNSLVFSGSKESLEKTQEILKIIDAPGADKGIGEFAGQTFFIYKVKHLSVSALLNLLKNVVINLEKESAHKDEALIKSIKTAKGIQETHSILFTGAPDVLEKIAELLKQLDISNGAERVEGDIHEDGRPSDYVIYKPVNVTGPELIEMMTEFEQNLVNSDVHNPQLFQTIGSLKYIQRTGYILVSGSKKAIEQAIDLLRKFDQAGIGPGVTSIPEMETSFLVYKLQYHQGTAIQDALKKVGQEMAASENVVGKNLVNAISSVQWITLTNSLLATGTPEVLTKLKELIQNLDVPLRQVFIEILVIETALTNNQQFGLQWGSKVQYLNRFGAGVSNFPSPNSVDGVPANNALATPLADVTATRTPLASDIPNPTSRTTNLAGGFDLGVIGDIILHKGRSFISLASLVNALQQDNESTIVMNPKLIAQDNQQSTIFIGQNIPFTGSLVTTTGAATQSSSNIEYRDVGVNLTITPILGTNEIVTLDISNDITRQVETVTGQAGGLQGLQTTRTTFTAKVHVPNKHFVALSGMIEDSKARFKSSIPCLGGLPIVGAFFSENDRFSQRNSIIFFVRPTIIDSFDEYKDLTETQENLYKDRASKQILKEQFDEAIDWVKQPEDE